MSFFLSLLIIVAVLALFFPRTASAFEAEFNQVPMNDVLRIFSKELEMNIMPDPKILGIKVTASLKNISAEDAFDLILKMNGLTFNEEAENTITVFKISDTARFTAARVHTFRVSYGDPELIAKTLKIIYPRVDFVPERSSNTILAAGHFAESDIGRIKKRIGELDRRAPRVRVNFEIVRASVSDVISATAIMRQKKEISPQSINFVFEDIKSRSRSVSRANLTLMPGANPSSIKRTTTVPYNVVTADGKPAGVAEREAGDMVEVRVISATEDEAVLEFAVDATQFITAGGPAVPPSSSGERLRSTISVKNGEKAVIGGLGTGKFNVVDANTYDERSGESRSGRTVTTGDDDFFMLLEVHID